MLTGLCGVNIHSLQFVEEFATVTASQLAPVRTWMNRSISWALNVSWRTGRTTPRRTAEYARQIHCWDALPAQPATDRKKVAIIGAGPAGLTAGLDLVRLGHKVKS